MNDDVTTPDDDAPDTGSLADLEREDDGRGLFGRTASDDALDVNAAINDPARQAVAATDDDFVPGDDDQPAGDPPAGDEDPADEPDPGAGDEPPVDDDGTPDTSTATPPASTGKTLAEKLAEIEDPEKLRQMVLESNNQLGKQTAELGRLRAQQEAWDALGEEEQRAAAAAGLQPAGTAPLAPAAPPEPGRLAPEAIEQVLDLAVSDPMQAYKVAQEAVDRGMVTPELLDAVTDIATELDGRIGNHIRQQRIEHEVETRVQAQLQQSGVLDETTRIRGERALATLKQQTDALVAHPELGPDMREYAADVAAIVNANPSQYLGNPSPEGIRDGIMRALREARGADPSRSSAVRAAQEALAAQRLELEKQGAHTELGITSGDAPAPANEEEAYRAQVFAQNRKQRDVVTDLFAS